MAQLFISQDQLDEWTADDKATLVGDEMHIPEMGYRFSTETAVRFVTVAGGEADPHGLLGKVVSEKALAEQGADLYMNSVIHGDIAYDVIPGFLGRVLP